MDSLESLRKKQLASTMTQRDWAFLALLSETKAQVYTRLPGKPLFAHSSQSIDMSLRSTLEWSSEAKSYNSAIQQFSRVLRGEALSHEETPTILDLDFTRVRQKGKPLFDGDGFSGRTLRFLPQQHVSLMDLRISAAGFVPQVPKCVLDDLPVKRMFQYNGIKIKYEYVQARTHNARRGSAAYHARIQKKWLYRFGCVQKRVQLDPIVLMFSALADSLLKTGGRNA